MCPITDETELVGIDIFDADPLTVERLMLGDPAVQAGVLTYEVHPARSFPGDSLPGRDTPTNAGP